MVITVIYGLYFGMQTYFISLMLFILSRICFFSFFKKLSGALGEIFRFFL